MKKFISILSIVLLSVVSCVQERTPMENDNGGKDKLEIKLRGSIDQMATKADDKGFYDGDAFGVYITDDTGSIAENERFVYDAASSSWISDHTIYFSDLEKNVSIVGYYPYKDNLENPNAFPFEVAKDQRKPAANGMVGGYEASDLLYASKKDVKPTADVITLLFKHRLANMKVTLLEGAGWAEGEWTQVSKDVLVTNTVRQSVVNLSTGAVQVDGEDRSIGIVPLAMGNDVWRAVVVPQEVSADMPIVSVTIDGQAREYMYGSAYHYYDGKQNSLTLAVNKTDGYQGIDLELVSEGITPWEDDANVRDESSRDYLVVNCPEGGKLKETIQKEGYQLASIQNLKLEGFINAYDFFFMRDELPILKALNLMDVRIEECYYSSQNYTEWFNEDCIPSFAFEQKKTLTKIVFPKTLVKIGIFSFSKSSLKGDLTFPEGVSSIGGYAFNGIALNGTVIFPSTIKEIGGDAFSESAVRGDLFLPEGLETIGAKAFYGTDIKSLTLPSTLEDIGFQAFAECSNLTGSIEIPAGVKVLEDIFSNCKSLNGELLLHEGLEIIGNMAFGWCPLSGVLAIPSTVKSIGDDAFFGSDFRSISLPESLISLGTYVFASNDSRSNEVPDLIIPEGVTNIPEQCFRGLNIVNLNINKNVEYIAQGAFADCIKINSIVCKAIQPPILENGVFNGVAKDNFALEVPEESVKDYQNASGWNEFKRIVAHRDFSISRRLYRTLNKAETKSFTLRAEPGASWTVESKPDWVTITPMSGTGKTEVTVSVSALPLGAGNREGEVVYNLDGKNYSVSTKVEQFDYQYADGDVYTVQNHSKGRGVHLIFMGDCYDAKDICEGKYLDNTLEAVEHFFGIEPYKTYRDYFDVHIVIGCSEDSGVGDVNTIREAKFGSQYSLTDGVMVDDVACLSYAAKVGPSTSSIAGICLVLNSDLEDGVTYLYDNDLFISLCPMGKGQYPNDFRGVVQHEAGGHGFGKLGEETIYASMCHLAFIQKCNPGHYPEFLYGKARGWYDNLSLTGDMQKVPWAHLIYDSKYSDMVDVFEGGFYHARGVFRSEANSCMRNKIPYYSTISRESIVKRIMRYAGVKYSFDSFKANDVTGASVNTKSFLNWEISLYDVGHHREPVIKGEFPEISINR